MTISIKLPNASFTNNIGNGLLPFMENALAYNLYGGDFASTAENRIAGGGIDLTPIGAAVIESNYAIGTYTTGFSFGMLMNIPQYTLIAVGRVRADGPGYMSLFGHGIDAGNPNTLYDAITSGVWYDVNNQTTAYVRGTAVASGAYPTTSQGNNWTFVAGASAPTGGQSTVAVKLASTLVSFATTAGAGTTMSQPLRMGNTNYLGGDKFDVAASVIYNRALNLVEQMQVYAHLKAVLAARGVAVM